MRMGGGMTWSKRLFDIVLAVILAIVLAPVTLIVACLLLVTEGRPLFYISERMRDPETPFALVKFRTMRVDAGAGGVTGGDKLARISKMQSLLRRSRMDELPQLWNVLRGDMSFVGPRPPLRTYTDAFPELYREVLKSRPGITGLASLVFHKREEAILARCHTPAETDAAYRRLCVPRKAQLDLLYQRNWSMCLDLKLIWRTASGLFLR